MLGHDLVADRAAVRRSVGLLGHDTALYDDLTVEENLRFWARASRIDDEAVPAALDRLGVAERLRDVAVRNLLRGNGVAPPSLRWSFAALASGCLTSLTRVLIRADAT